MNNAKKEPFASLIAPENNSGKMTVGLADGEAGDATVDMGYITFFPRQQQHTEHDENSGAFSPQPDNHKAWDNSRNQE